MLLRHASWTFAAAALFLVGCKNNNDSVAVTATDSYLVTSGNRLVSLDLLTSGSLPVSLSISGLAAGERIAGIAFRPNDGLLYGLVVNGSSGRLVVIDPLSGSTTAVSTLSADSTDSTAPFTTLSGTRFGIDFNPVVDRLRVVSDTGENLRINVATGATITDTALNGVSTGATAAAYTNAFNAACRTALFSIDPASDRLLLQSPPNDGVLTAVGGLGIDATSVSGFDVATSATGTNTAYAVLTTSDGTRIYTINTTTGAATAGTGIGLSPGETAVGFATRPQAATPTQAAGELVGLTTANGYVSFQRGSPSKLCSSGAITGLPAGTDLLGIDTRPSTGGIVALGSDNRLYSLSSAGDAALLCTLIADPADLTTPFSALPTGASFGVGFNPVPDRLRVVASNGSNLRINPNPNGSSQCLVTTDTAITGATSVTGVGYTNAIPAAGTTALYAIDSGADALVRIGSDPAVGTAGDPGNPNSGVATAIGPLGADLGSTDAFLIDGRNNGALLAGSSAGASASTLYTVNLMTGAATASGTIGGGLGTPSAPTLRGLALTTGTTLKVYALTTDNHLLSFSQTGNALMPNTVTDVAITGLSAGENLLGIDTRPANSLLYGVSSQNRVYVINTSTGLATLSSTLAADAADSTAPFATVATGETFGTDFNPVPDRLRVVDTAGNNLRINVASGATTTDGLHNGAVSGGVVAAGYTNAFAGTTATTLYVFDGTTLYTQVPPNNGTLVSVGSLGVTANGDAGFDIAGGANGLVLAAIQTSSSAAPSSDLYRINLATGVATPIGTPGGTAQIGPVGTQQIRSLAIDLR